MMTVGVDLVQSMGQHPHCLIAIGQGLTMGIDIHTISQTTDYQHIGAMAFQVADEMAYQVLSIDCHLSRPHDTHYLRLVQVAIAFIIEYERGIGTFAEPLRIVVIAQYQASDTVLLHIVEFKICPFHRIIPILKSLHQRRRGFFDDVANLVPMFIQQLCTAHRFIQFQRLLIIKVRQARQCHHIE